MRGARLGKQILFCMVENAVVGMSVSMAEETAVKDPEDDEAFRADDLRARERKRRGLVLSRKLKPRLWQTKDVNRACCQYFFSARAEHASARMVHIGVDAAVVGGPHRMLGVLLLFHLGLVAGQTRRTSVAPFVSHVNFPIGVTAYEKLIHMLSFRQPVFPLFQAHKL